MSETVTLWLIPGCPLAAAVIVGLFGRVLFAKTAHVVVVAALVVSCLLSLFQLGHVAVAAGHATQESAETAGSPAQHAAGPVAEAKGYEWVSIGGLHVEVALRVDALSAVMLAMVTFVSLLVAIYASGYMHGDPGYPRFFAELALFVFSMCMLVMARNFVVLFAFWEAVGLCSYLLIGFWFERPSASSAAVKAFVMNRIGDAAFLIAIYMIWRTFGSLDFLEVFRGRAAFADPPPDFSSRILTICLCLFIGACGKSAQFPLHLWLPDAMEGPTPVSALIHAATMVTAGVYLVARCTPLFVLAPEAQVVVATIGGITALLAALIALTQTDLKRVLAYSTISQLGYMFMALGSAAAGEAFALAAVTAAIFHMFTHAFFKALLFLSAGNVMHAMGNVIDMRQFRGLRTVMPWTHWSFLCGGLALSGFPLLSGFWSKDEIFGLLVNATHHGAYPRLFQILFVVAFVTALLTAFYTFRAYFLTFFGPLRIPPEAMAHAAHGSHGSDHHGAVDHHGAGDHPRVHEGPRTMTLPLAVLAVFAVAVGVIVGPTGLFAGWVEQMPSSLTLKEVAFEWGLAGASALAAIAGIAIAYVMYAEPSDRPAKVAAAAGPFYQLSLNKFYLDEVATVLVSFPVSALAFISLLFDQGLIDRLVDFVGSIPFGVGRFLRPVQNGFIQSYALVMIFGLAIFLTTVLQVWMVRM
ncbi:MAG TPA: NADH-quinone oxidoreductase subunit L [Planctomycetaceae bacterium]|jgi:NADH-quinone oxidoreductase subunit L|nr:NADH-quinone oxidoreductase subunit L [Planctomycetaceae bacterium]